MNRRIFATLTKRSFGIMLYRAVCVLLVLTALTTCSISGVYARYIAAGSVDGAANMASIGIEVFDLVQSSGKVVPGADMAGPYIKLQLDSEVSYTLFVLVKVPKVDYIEFGGDNMSFDDDSGDVLIKCAMSASWTLTGDEYEVTEDGVEYTVYKYKYIVSSDNGVNNYIFRAGTPFKTTDDEGKDAAQTIKILQDDTIYVSENFSKILFDKDDEKDKDFGKFSLKFEAYIQQVLSNS